MLAKHRTTTFAAAGLALGLTLGLLMGWVVWPVSWQNAVPADLSPRYQAEFVFTIADAYVANRDERAALRRLSTLADPETALAAASDVLASTPSLSDSERNIRYTNLQILAELVYGGGAAPVTAGPATALSGPSPAPTSLRTGSLFNQVLALIAAALLIGGGLWIAYRRLWPSLAGDATALFGERSRAGRASANEGWRRGFVPAQRTPSPTLNTPPVVDFDAEPINPSLTAVSPASHPRPAEAQMEIDSAPTGTVARGGGPAPRRAAGDPSRKASIVSALDKLAGAARQAMPAVATPPRPEPAVSRATTPQREAAPSRETNWQQNHFTAEYRAGIVDYEQPFPIMKPGTDDYAGECGMGASGSQELVSDLEVWLFDKSLISTQTQLLLSEYAVRQEPPTHQPDTGNPAPIEAKPGATFRLEGKDLTLTCRVVAVEYLHTEPQHSAFSRVEVEMIARHRGDRR